MLDARKEAVELNIFCVLITGQLLTWPHLLLAGGEVSHLALVAHRDAAAHEADLQLHLERGAARVGHLQLLGHVTPGGDGGRGGRRQLQAHGLRYCGLDNRS